MNSNFINNLIHLKPRKSPCLWSVFLWMCFTSIRVIDRGHLHGTAGLALLVVRRQCLRFNYHIASLIGWAVLALCGQCLGFFYRVTSFMGQAALALAAFSGNARDSSMLHPSWDRQLLRLCWSAGDVRDSSILRSLWERQFWHSLPSPGNARDSSNDYTVYAMGNSENPRKT